MLRQSARLDVSTLASVPSSSSAFKVFLSVASEPRTAECPVLRVFASFDFAWSILTLVSTKASRRLFRVAIKRADHKVVRARDEPSNKSCRIHFIRQIIHSAAVCQAECGAAQRSPLPDSSRNFGLPLHSLAVGVTLLDPRSCTIPQNVRRTAGQRSADVVSLPPTHQAC